MAEEERDSLLSASQSNDIDEEAEMKRNSDSRSKLASADVASSIKDVSIEDSCQNKSTGLFRKSVSAAKSHRRVVSRDSDSNDEWIGPPVPWADSAQPQPSTHAADDSDDDEIGPPAPTAVSVQNINKRGSSDEEIGPPLPDAAGSDSKQDDKDSDDDDSDDGDDEVALSSFICYCFQNVYLFAPRQILW